jgi:hypothetical protein
VHVQQRRRLGPDGLRVVGQACAVGRAHLHQPRPALLQHVGDAKPAADLDRLPARDHDLPAAGKLRQHEQHGGGVVVHCQPRLRARDPADQGLEMGRARAAAARFEVELEVGIARRRHAHRVQRRRTEWRSTQVGVQHHAGRVDHPAQARRPQRRCRPQHAGHGGARHAAVRQAPGAGRQAIARAQRLAQPGQLVTRQLGDDFPGQRPGQRRHVGLAQQRIDAWQLTHPFGCAHRHRLSFPPGRQGTGGQ